MAIPLSTLTGLGLNDKEARVYLACLELGSGTVQEVATKSRVKRTSIYNFLDTLIADGYVSEVRRGSRVILVAESPELLRRKAEQRLSSITQGLPGLLELFRKSGEQPRVHFYQGITGIKRVYEDSLATAKPIVAFSNFEKMMPLMQKFLWDYASRRAAKGIEFSTIAQPGEWANKVFRRNAEQRRTMKIAKDLDLDVEINIYGNKAALISFEHPFVGVIIEDKAIANSLRSIWQLLWERS